MKEIFAKATSNAEEFAEALAEALAHARLGVVATQDASFEYCDAEKQVLKIAHERISEVLEWAEAPDKELCIQGIYAIVGIMQMTDAVIEELHNSEWGKILEYRTTDKR